MTPRRTEPRASHGPSGAPGDAAVAVAAAVSAECRSACPTVAIILGSGLGGFADHIECATRLRFADIPGVSRTTVSGHAGELTHGLINGREVVALAGRLHWYEGHPSSALAFAVRVVYALGARVLFASNAAGAVRRGLRAGDLMVIRDHINLMWRNPLIGPAQPREARFPDMSAPYDEALSDIFLADARRVGARVQEGVYAAMLGPAYETPAEVRMLSHLGVDAVGMSTVPEVIVARALGMRVVGVSCITNAASGLTRKTLSHADVLSTGAAAAPIFERALRAWLLSID